MTPGGWLIMLLSVGTVVALFLWCMAKVLISPQDSEHMHGFSEETPDVSEDNDC